MNKMRALLKVRLSLEPAYQTIYWSICWLTFFLSLILILENQHPVTTIIMGISGALILFFGLGCRLTLSSNELKISYFRKIKVKTYSLSNFTKLSFSERRLIQLEKNDSKEPLIFYLNKKNKKAFILAIQHHVPELEVEELMVGSKKEQ